MKYFFATKIKRRAIFFCRKKILYRKVDFFVSKKVFFFTEIDFFTRVVGTKSDFQDFDRVIEFFKFTTIINIY